MSKVNPSTGRNKEIIAAVIRGSKEGKTNKQVAEEVGLSEASFQTHTSNLRKVLAGGGFELPKLGRSGSGGVNKAEQVAAGVEFARSLLAELSADETGEAGDVETGEELELGDDS